MTAATNVKSAYFASVFNQKGGIAKTTTASNIAIGLAVHGYKVILIDLDSQGNATTNFGISPLPLVGAYDVITGRAPLADCLLYTRFPGLKILPATNSLSLADVDLAISELQHTLLKNRFIADRTDVDFVVIDCPPALSAITINAMVSSNSVLIPCRADPFAHDGLLNTWYAIKQIRRDLNKGLHIGGIILTMTEKDQLSLDITGEIRGEFGDAVFPAEIEKDVTVLEAARRNLPVTVYDPECPASTQYLDTTYEFLRRVPLHEDSSHVGLHQPRSRDEVLQVLREWRDYAKHLIDDAAIWPRAPTAQTQLENLANPELIKPSPAKTKSTWPTFLYGAAVGAAAGYIAGNPGAVKAILMAVYQ